MKQAVWSGDARTNEQHDALEIVRITDRPLFISVGVIEVNWADGAFGTEIVLNS